MRNLVFAFASVAEPVMGTAPTALGRGTKGAQTFLMQLDWIGGRMANVLRGEPVFTPFAKQR
jgi:hypothetical protein